MSKFEGTVFHLVREGSRYEIWGNEGDSPCLRLGEVPGDLAGKCCGRSKLPGGETRNGGEEWLTRFRWGKETTGDDIEVKRN